MAEHRFEPRAAATGHFNDETLLANDDLRAHLSAPGGGDIRIQVRSTGSFQVGIDWLNKSAGSLRRELGVLGGPHAGGTWVRGTVTGWSAWIRVRILDESGADQTVNASIHY